MTSVTSGSVTVTYTYDGAGQKVRRQGPSGAQRYYYDYFADVPRILAEADAGSGTFQTIYQRDIFGNLLSDGATWHQFDGLGSIVSRTNSTGTLVGSTLYGAWGTVRSQSGTQGKWGFTGAEWDPDAKGYHMGARWYDPSLGRWWAEDPVREGAFNPATLNFYTYGGNNPEVLIDIDGRSTCSTLGRSDKCMAYTHQLFSISLDLSGMAGWSKGLAVTAIAGAAWQYVNDVLILAGVPPYAAWAFAALVAYQFGRDLYAALPDVLPPGMNMSIRVFATDEGYKIVILVCDSKGRVVARYVLQVPYSWVPPPPGPVYFALDQVLPLPPDAVL